jgi:hypothetical protein
MGRRWKGNSWWSEGFLERSWPQKPISQKRQSFNRRVGFQRVRLLFDVLSTFFLIDDYLLFDGMQIGQFGKVQGTVVLPSAIKPKKIATLLDIFVSRNAARLATNRLSKVIGINRCELCGVAWKMSSSVENCLFHQPSSIR